jgi:hypothetical protein
MIFGALAIRVGMDAAAVEGMGPLSCGQRCTFHGRNFSRPESWRGVARRDRDLSDAHGAITTGEADKLRA